MTIFNGHEKLRKSLEADYRHYQSKVDSEFKRLLGCETVRWQPESLDRLSTEELAAAVQRMRATFESIRHERIRRMWAKISIWTGDEDSDFHGQGLA